MKEKVLNLTPSSILDKVDSKFFIEIEQEQHQSYIKSGNYYENYYALSSYYQPKSILEIGVRYGYSLGSIISASNVIEKVTGIDNDEYSLGSLEVAKDNIKKYINSNVELNFSLQDSHKIKKLESDLSEATTMLEELEQKISCRFLGKNKQVELCIAVK